MKDLSHTHGNHPAPEGNTMTLFAKILLILFVSTLPAALWLGGDWWKWAITALTLVLAAAIADQDTA